MKNKLYLLLISAVMCVIVTNTFAQNTFPSSGSVGIGTLAPATTLQVIGTSRFGGAANYGQFATDGDLTFVGTGDYLVAGNHYAFRYSADQDIGLFFSAASSRYEFRNSAGVATSHFTADGAYTASGNIVTSGNVTGVNFIASGDLTTGASNGVINCGGAINTLVNVIGDATTPTLSLANGDEDLFVEDDLEVGGTIFSSNNMGIGVAFPDNTLHVFKGSAGTVTGNTSAPLVVENSTHCYINVLAPATSETGILFGNSGSAQDGGIIYLGTGDDMVFRTNGNVTRMTLTDAGALNITGTLDVAGATLSLGSVENITDGGAFTIHTNSNIDHETDNLDGLGVSTNRWVDVWAVDGTINTSDVREKTNIRDLSYGINEVMKLRPVSYTWIANPERGTKIGLIAQDLQQVIPEVVRDWERKTNEETGERMIVPSARLGVMYDDIIPVLVSAIQDQQTLIDEKESRIQEQGKQIDELKTRVDQLQALITGDISSDGALKISVNDNNAAMLGQNIPNPFDNSTVIPFRVPKDCNSASMVIYDAIGKLVTAIPISCTETHLVLESASLSSGTYTYSLIVNGNVVDTKQMVISK